MLTKDELDALEDLASQPVEPVTEDGPDPVTFSGHPVKLVAVDDVRNALANGGLLGDRSTSRVGRGLLSLGKRRIDLKIKPPDPFHDTETFLLECVNLVNGGRSGAVDETVAKDVARQKRELTKAVIAVSKAVDVLARYALFVRNEGRGVYIAPTIAREALTLNARGHNLDLLLERVSNLSTRTETAQRVFRLDWYDLATRYGLPETLWVDAGVILFHLAFRGRRPAHGTFKTGVHEDRKSRDNAS